MMPLQIITDARCTDYQSPGHPERPARILGTLSRLRTLSNLRIEWGAPAAVSRDQVLRAHSAGLYKSVTTGDGDLDGDTPRHPGIDQHALRSVGGALEVLRLARSGGCGFSLLRPPGHHATADQAMGFCYFNSIAIATLEALALGVKRVAVFDFDVHHGNGTEDILLGRKGTAFYSIHQSPCYPGTGLSHRGTNVFNYPVRPRIPRQEYRDVLSRALDELGKFKPDLIGVSAGFDAYVRDPLAQGTLEAEDYHWLGKRIRAFDVPFFSVLEGGYSDDLPELIEAYLRGIAPA